jgi:hypothetical protein
MPQVKIFLRIPDGDKTLAVTLPADIPLNQLLPALVRKLGLVEGDYILRVTGDQNPLPKELSLEQSKINPGMELQLEPMVIVIEPQEEIMPREIPPPLEQPEEIPSQTSPTSHAAWLPKIGWIALTWVVVAFLAAMIVEWLYTQWQWFFRIGKIGYYLLTTIAWAISGGIGGLITCLILQSTIPSFKRMDLWIITAGWSAAWAIAGFLNTYYLGSYGIFWVTALLGSAIGISSMAVEWKRNTA